MDKNNEPKDETMTTTEEITKARSRVTSSTPATNSETHPLILNALIKMKNEGKSDYTIKHYDKMLTFLADHADLSKPEQVKRFIATHKTSNGHKRNLCIAYNYYAKTHGIEWEKPKYRQEPKPIRIPTKEKLEILISNARTNLSIKLQLSMETGLRPIELCRLKAKDIDLEHRTVNPTTAKGGNPRTIPLSASLTAKKS